MSEIILNAAFFSILIIPITTLIFVVLLFLRKKVSKSKYLFIETGLLSANLISLYVSISVAFAGDPGPAGLIIAMMYSFVWLLIFLNYILSYINYYLYKDKNSSFYKLKIWFPFVCLVVGIMYSLGYRFLGFLILIPSYLAFLLFNPITYIILSLFEAFFTETEQNTSSDATVSGSKLNNLKYSKSSLIFLVVIQFLCMIIIYGSLVINIFFDIFRHNFAWQTVVGLLLFRPQLILGFIIIFLSFREFGFKVNPTPEVVKNQKLITTGIYKYIRHPIYLGVILSTLLSFITSGIFVVWILLVFTLIVKIRIEEELLQAEFGEEFTKYKTTTKRLIPLIY